MATYKEIEPFREGVRIRGGLSADSLTLAGVSATTSLGATGPTGPTGTGATGPTGAAGATGPAFTNSVSATVSAAGSARSSATTLTSLINVITTAAASTGVSLIASATVGIGGSVMVYNDGANPVQVYALGSDTIDTLAGTVGVTLTNGHRAAFTLVAANTFKSHLLGGTST